MGFSLVQQGGRLDYNYKEYYVDTPEDIADLPTTPLPGSSAVVMSTGEVYFLNTSGEWVKV